tara:strand:+ start:1401 stop:1898 length:498 start_codon:yes stop_codon:yes gene_type:complete
MNCTSTNGRIDILGPNKIAVFEMADKMPTKDCSSYLDAVCGNWNRSALSDKFFSKENLVFLQNEMKKGIYKASNGHYVIGDQDYNELKTIMRSIFLQNSRNLPHNINEQVSDLNKLVLDYAISHIYKEIVAYLKYKRDVSTIACPLALPKLAREDHKQLMYNNPF